MLIDPEFLVAPGSRDAQFSVPLRTSISRSSSTLTTPGLAANGSSGLRQAEPGSSPVRNASQQSAIIDQIASALTNQGNHREMYVVVFNHVVIIVPLLIPTLILHAVVPYLRRDTADLWDVATIALLRFVELLPAVMVVVLMLDILKALLIRLFSVSSTR